MYLKLEDYVGKMRQSSRKAKEEREPGQIADRSAPLPPGRMIPQRNGKPFDFISTCHICVTLNQFHKFGGHRVFDLTSLVFFTTSGGID